MSDLSEFIAATIAENRAKHAREKLRDKILQEAQLAGGRLIDDADGVVAEYEDCPVCCGTETVGAIEIRAPFGVEASLMAKPRVVRWAQLEPDVLMWGIQTGVLKLGLDNKKYDVFAEDASPESAHNIGAITQALAPKDETDVLKVIPSEKLKAE